MHKSDFKKPIKIAEARSLAKDLAPDGWSTGNFRNSIDTSGFLKCDGNSVRVNWDRIDQFADEVSARTIVAIYEVFGKE